MSKTRVAAGSGSIRKRADGIWEGRFTIGYDPGTGKQMRRSVYGSSQSVVRRKMAAAIAALDEGTYFNPERITLGRWLDEWLEVYVKPSVKPYTYKSYAAAIRNHLKPCLGAVPLLVLSPTQIQSLYNSLLSGTAKHQQRAEASGGSIKSMPLSAKTIKNLHGVLHKALAKASELRYINTNPADMCSLPKTIKPEIKPLEAVDMANLVHALRGEEYRNLIMVSLFTGMRQGEVLGLSWSNINFNTGTITVCQQLQRQTGTGYYLTTPKSNKRRTIYPAPFVMDLLRDEQRRQMAAQLRAGSLWNNQWDLVFTTPLGDNLALSTVANHFKKIVTKIDLPSARFHDLRHTYAVTALQNGDDIKTVQETLGHATASFTLDVYGHVTDQAKKASALRMQNAILNLTTG